MVSIGFCSFVTPHSTRRERGWQISIRRFVIMRAAPTSKLLLMCACASIPRIDDVAILLVRPGDDHSVIGGLESSLARTNLPLVRYDAEWGADADTIVSQAAGEAPVRAIFELSVCSTTSMGLLDLCAGSGADLYRWDPAVSMFKRHIGTAGPAWLAAGSAGGVSEDIITEERGWGYLSGDEEQVVDTASLSDDEIRTLLDIPSPSTAPAAEGGEVDESDQSMPRVSLLGYALPRATGGASLASSPPPHVVTHLTDLARDVLLHGATEPAGSGLLADGTRFPAEGSEGTFVSPVTGAPLLTSAQRLRSTTGWPSFRHDEGAPTAQHLTFQLDVQGGVPRNECVELSSGAHVGHDFEGTLCLNAAALLFVPAGHAPPDWLPSPAAPAIGVLLHTHPVQVGHARVATLAAGCFWTLRSALAVLPGVLVAMAGFTGGSAARATYEQVIGGETGHVEAVQIAYDPTVISFDQLLERYWELVPDPTTRYRQGADVGSWYEPAIFFHSAEQRDAALATRAQKQHAMSEAAGRAVEVVTRIRPAREFWVASDQHQRS